MGFEVGKSARLEQRSRSRRTIFGLIKPYLIFREGCVVFRTGTEAKLVLASASAALLS